MDAGRADHFALGQVESHDQQELPFPEQRPQGVGFLREGARAYAESRGMTYSSEGLDQMQADPTFQHRVADFYERSQGAEHDHRVKSAYSALAAEVNHQYDYLTRPTEHGGMGVNVSFEPELEGTSIYPTHEHLVADIMQNRQLRVNKTGSSDLDQAVGHPFLDPDTNDKFRAVHDAFGHAAIGRSFSRHGEEAAYHSHAQMFSPAARPALAAETRLQNSTLNYGRTPGVFPEQKPLIAPAWALRSRIPRSG
ncbi:MAG TPA: hypothetical protein VFI41_05360 [Gemmatimonadales bacterium]|nr:hypothetical protein [Gemmatimonadales bacterium]